MRLVTPVVIRPIFSLALALLISTPVLSQTGNRYEATNFDPEEIFRSVPSKPASGGYRSAAPAAPSRPAATLPRENDLRTTPKTTPSKPPRPATPPAASRPLADLPPIGAKPSSRPPSRPTAADPFKNPAAAPAPLPPSRATASSPSPRRGSPAGSSTASSLDLAPLPTRPSGSANRATPARSAATPPPRRASQPPTPPASFANTPRSTPRPQQPPRATRNIAPIERSVAPPNGRVATAIDESEYLTHEKLADMLRLPPKLQSQSQLRGTPTSLGEVISTATSREDQARRVDAYWALTSAVADYYLGLTEQHELQKLRNLEPTFSRSLGAASQKLAIRVGTSLKAAQSAQYRLARLTDSPAMPLPSDIPFTGRYHTKLNEMFPAGAPAEARLLDELLPLRLAELREASKRLVGTEDWIVRVRAQRTTSVEGVLKALQLNALSRRAFVQLARDYNLQINRYTQLAKPEPVDTGRLVAMLIRERPLLARVSSGSNPTSLNFRSGASPRR